MGFNMLSLPRRIRYALPWEIKCLCPYKLVFTVCEKEWRGMLMQALTGRYRGSPPHSVEDLAKVLCTRIDKGNEWRPCVTHVVKGDPTVMCKECYRIFADMVEKKLDTCPLTLKLDMELAAEEV